MDTIKATSSVILLDWESSHFVWSVPISINDCAKYIKNYLEWLETTGISSFESIELFDVIKPKNQHDEVMKSEHIPCGRSTPFWYLDAILKNFDISKEYLAEAYVQSRVMKSSYTSIEKKYKFLFLAYTSKLIKSWIEN